MALWVFALAALYDFLVVRYLRSIQDDKRISASILSMVIGANMLFSFLTVNDERWLSVPNILGFGFGTYIAMSIGRKKDA